MSLYYSILVAIWLAVIYAIWAATAAGDPGYGQAAFLAGGIFATLHLRKRNRERPQIDLDKIGNVVLKESVVEIINIFENEIKKA